MTRDRLPGDPPAAADVDAARAHARALLAEVAPRVLALGPPDRAVVTSKTFRSLARLDGAAPSGQGPFVERRLSRAGLAKIVAKVAPMTGAERAGLPGVSEGRARQLLAGALVAQEAMAAFGLEEVQVCPWALREGVILRRLDWLAGT